MNMLIKNAKTAENEICDIFVKNGVIDNIKPASAQNSPKNHDVYDADGMWVLPGFIDLNCDICDPGYEHKEDIITVSESAAKGGFTSVACNPLTLPILDNKTVVTYVINKAKALSKVNIFPLGSMTIGGKGKEMSEIGEMRSAGIVGVSDGNAPISDTSVLRTILIYSSLFDMPVITFCEDKQLSGDGVMNLGYYSTYMGLMGKPKEAEEVYIARALMLAKSAKSRLHITHVSTKTSVGLIRFAKAHGIAVTCDTCPHYFTLTEEAVSGYNTFAKVNPPLRQQEDIEAVIEGIKDGTIDAITSGHSPTSVESKRTEFDRAAFGISSLETTFSLCLTALVKTKTITMEQLAQKLSKIPASILKLEYKGQIKKGFDADMVIVDDSFSYTINAKDFISKAKFSPHDGHKVTGKVISTFVGGKLT